MLLSMLVHSVAVFRTGATRKAKSRIVLVDGNIFARAGFIVIVAVAVFVLVFVRACCTGEGLAVWAEYRRAAAGAAQAASAEHHADGHHRHSKAEGNEHNYEYGEHGAIVARSGVAGQVKESGCWEVWEV